MPAPNNFFNFFNFFDVEFVIFFHLGANKGRIFTYFRCNKGPYFSRENKLIFPVIFPGYIMPVWQPQKNSIISFFTSGRKRAQKLPE
jgi:hypothetical protein